MPTTKRVTISDAWLLCLLLAVRDDMNENIEVRARAGYHLKLQEKRILG